MGGRGVAASYSSSTDKTLKRNEAHPQWWTRLVSFQCCMSPHSHMEVYSQPTPDGVSHASLLVIAGGQLQPLDVAEVLAVRQVLVLRIHTDGRLVLASLLG